MVVVCDFYKSEIALGSTQSGPSYDCDGNPSNLKPYIHGNSHFVRFGAQQEQTGLSPHPILRMEPNLALLSLSLRPRTRTQAEQQRHLCNIPVLLLAIN